MSISIENNQTAKVKALAADALYTPPDLSALVFQTTNDLDTSCRTLGQDRAMTALQLASTVPADGYNIFVIGSEPLRLREIVRTQLQLHAAQLPTPPDWVYVNNFKTPHKPVAIELPAGKAPYFRDQMRELIQDLKISLPAAFGSGEFQTQKDSIDNIAQDKQEAAFSELQGKATERQLAIVRTPMGFGLVPVRNGQPIPPNEFHKLSREEQESIQSAMRDLEPLLEKTIRTLPGFEKERRDALRKLTRDTAQFAVGQSIDELKELFKDTTGVLTYLDEVRRDIAENVGLFVASQSEDGVEENPSHLGEAFGRYEVNVLKTSDVHADQAPVFDEPHPTLGNLVGRIEHIAQQGVLITNFRLIKCGALHRANGGFLLLDARALLTEPLSWPALKRAILQKKIEIEDIGRALGLSSTVSLEPDSIPLSVKVVLFGDRYLYYLIRSLDSDVARHFKVVADFDDEVERSSNTECNLALLIAEIAQQQNLSPIDREGVLQVIEHSSRLISDQKKLSLYVDIFSDILIEAGYWAKKDDATVISGKHVATAIEQRERRDKRIEGRIQESILREIDLIDVTGKRVGQINGLSVLSIGGYSFGKPTRITCRVRPGSGKIVDIEREVELGGPTHSKGILILSGFLAGRYALDSTMSLYASIVFEQSYGGVDGDSASSAELYALLSSLSELPINQQLAVTGSVNQHGDVQPIGGVNQKIEGFFDVCKARGLSGEQGVLIPKANVQHLVLRKDVREACADRRFHIYPIETIDQGIELLTGRTAGIRGPGSEFPTGSVNRLVEERLEHYARLRRQNNNADDKAQGIIS